ncbi:hypothetical protein B0H14DRAFT_2569345 [Mycena olivaceomarginata]|nr:hypothetical protein B0H14DRAFT_2569345 [Mycena olivaceomarginata]
MLQVCGGYAIWATRADSAREFHRQVVNTLPELLEITTPSDHLFEVLRNKKFQHSLFTVKLSWPWEEEDADSPYPSDLMQLGEDHRYIFTLVDRLDRSRYPTSLTPTFRFDPIYTEIFTKFPDVLFVIKTLVVTNPPFPSLEDVFRLVGLTCNYGVLQPFLRFRGLVQLPFPKGDSPLDFLTDPGRAGDMSADRQDIAQEFVILWIHRFKEFLVSGGYLWREQNWLTQLIKQCPKSRTIVLELETLYVSALCGQMMVDPEAHRAAHVELYPSTLYPVLEWLWSFPHPPLQAITLWEKQIQAIKRECIWQRNSTQAMEWDLALGEELPDTECMELQEGLGDEENVELVHESAFDAFTKFLSDAQVAARKLEDQQSGRKRKRGTYTGKSKTTQWRTKKAEERLRELGYRNIKDLFAAQTAKKSGQNSETGEAESERGKSNRFQEATVSEPEIPASESEIIASEPEISEPEMTEPEIIDSEPEIIGSESESSELGSESELEPEKCMEPVNLAHVKLKELLEAILEKSFNGYLKPIGADTSVYAIDVAAAAVRWCAGCLQEVQQEEHKTELIFVSKGRERQGEPDRSNTGWELSSRKAVE